MSGEIINEKELQMIGGGIPEGKARVFITRDGKIKQYGDTLCIKREGAKINQHCVGAKYYYGSIGFKIVVIQKEKGVISSREFVGDKIFPEFTYQSPIGL